MRITLVFPPFYHVSMYNLPPLGLVNLASILDSTKHVGTILDQVLSIRTGQLTASADIYHDATRLILDTDPELVAFSAQCATYPPILQIAGLLKQIRPQVDRLSRSDTGFRLPLPQNPAPLHDEHDLLVPLSGSQFSGLSRFHFAIDKVCSPASRLCRTDDMLIEFRIEVVPDVQRLHDTPPRMVSRIAPTGHHGSTFLS